MNTRFTTSDLIRRPAHTQLDDMPIHIGDIVYLQPANGRRSAPRSSSTRPSTA